MSVGKSGPRSMRATRSKGPFTSRAEASHGGTARPRRPGGGRNDVVVTCHVSSEGHYMAWPCGVPGLRGLEQGLLLHGDLPRPFGFVSASWRAGRPGGQPFVSLSLSHCLLLGPSSCAGGGGALGTCFSLEPIGKGGGGRFCLLADSTAGLADSAVQGCCCAVRVLVRTLRTRPSAPPPSSPSSAAPPQHAGVYNF